MREPVEIEKRLSPSVGWKLQILARSGGCCSYPMCEVREGLEYDHICPRALGGKHRVDNYQVLCGHHHLQKSRLDVKMIAKAKRCEKKLTVGAERKPSRLTGGKFQTKLTRRFDNTVVLRKNKLDAE